LSIRAVVVSSSAAIRAPSDQLALLRQHLLARRHQLGAWL